MPRRPKRRFKPMLDLLRSLPQGHDEQGRTSPRANTFKPKKGAGSYRRRQKHRNKEE